MRGSILGAWELRFANQSFWFSKKGNASPTFKGCAGPPRESPSAHLVRDEDNTALPTYLPPTFKSTYHSKIIIIVETPTLTFSMTKCLRDQKHCLHFLELITSLLDNPVPNSQADQTRQAR